jgi:hypothetical protein
MERLPGEPAERDKRGQKDQNFRDLSPIHKRNAEVRSQIAEVRTAATHGTIDIR